MPQTVPCTENHRRRYPRWFAAGVGVVALVVASCSSTPPRSASEHVTDDVVLPLGAAVSFAPTPVECPGIALFPSPGTATASPTTQISFQGVDATTFDESAVAVTGSGTGDHAVRVVPNSDGSGVSAYPSEPFEPGETVTVSAPDEICGADGTTATFEVSGVEMADLPEDTAPGADAPERTDDDVQHFVSAPDLAAPALHLESADTAGGDDLFLLGPKGPRLTGGPMLIDGAGDLVWFAEAPEGTQVADVRVAEYRGEPVITYWQGKSTQGQGTGVGIILDESYQVVETVEAGNGYEADMHEFLLEPDGTAWITIYAQAPADLTEQGGPKNANVYDGIVQHLDVATGNVLFEWHSLDHVPFSASAMDYDETSPKSYDYFHVNAVDPSGHGTVLVSARNTDAVYLLNETTGEVIWTLGGTQSDFEMGEGTEFTFQHDARLRGDSHVTIFDNETRGVPARLLALTLDLDAMKASVTWEHTAPGDLTIASQGNLQLLANGNMVAGWGAEAPEGDRKNTSTVTEYDADGDVVFHARFVGTGVNTYRAYRQPWSARPTTDPVARTTADGDAVAVSWNGATGVASWQLATAATGGEVVTTVDRDGFETSIPLDGSADGSFVRALDADGHVLGVAPIRS